MKTFCTISCLAFFSVSYLQADEPSTLELKNKSTFTVDSNTRDPFWPIGFKPKTKAAKGDHSGPEIPPSAFLVSSITLGQARFAIVNGKIMQEGQQFGLVIGNQTYQVTVKAIEDGRVILSRRDEEIIVPLHRK